MRSMTGFGMGSASLGTATLAIEVRSLNHRYLDVRVRVPVELGEHAFFLEQLVRSRLERGRYDLSVRLEDPRSGQAQPELERLRAAWADLVRLRDEVAPGTELPLTALSLVTDVNQRRPPWKHEEIREALLGAVDRALAALDTMRQTEGTALLALFEAHLDKLRGLLGQLQALAAQTPGMLQRTVRDRVARLLAESGSLAEPGRLEPGRLEMEVALLVDRADITEELSRLACHIEQFDKVVHGSGATGRQLDFLLQEMMREANTLGAKSHVAAQSHLSVDLKTEIERMREQIQNVE